MPLQKLWLCTCLMAIAVFPVFAQPGPPPGGPGGPGPGNRGPGQRGGGNVVQASLEKLFQLDADKDGKLTKSEASDPRLQDLFGRADADKDGNVTRDEATALFAKESALMGRGGPDGPGGFGPPGGGPGGFGRGPGFGGPPPRIGQVLPPFLYDTLELSDKQREELQELQKEVDARLEKILSADQRRMLNEMAPRGPGGPGFGGPGAGPGGPRGQGQRGPGPRAGRPPGE